MQPIVAATSNRHKFQELSTVAREFNVTLLSPEETQRRYGLAAPPEVEETEDSYLGNALLKARAFLRWSGLPSLGDDSGLEVAALGNRPGVHSARYAGPRATSSQRIDKLLAELASLEASSGSIDRSACFRCVLVLAIPGEIIYSAEGALAGTVLHERRGSGGFGYDPIIRIDLLGCTLAEVDFEVTCSAGFRALAARKLFAQL